MPTNKNADLKQTYYELLMLKYKNETLGVKVHGLDELILKTRATMDNEDVTWVEKQIDEWKKSQ